MERGIAAWDFLKKRLKELGGVFSANKHGHFLAILITKLEVYLDVFHAEDFHDIVISAKSIDPLLVIDATEGEIQNQDLKIAHLAWEAGRGVILIVNKWDLAEKDDKAVAKYTKTAQEKAPFLKWVPFIFTSALTGQRVQRILDTIIEVAAERVKKIPTHEVNEQLQALIGRLQPPQAAGRDVKLNYATQVDSNPPTILVFGNNPDLVQEHYIRYLHNGFRAAWGFMGNPLRISLRRKSAPPE